MPDAEYRIAVYLARNSVGGDLPPEQFYSTVLGGEAIGYVVSKHPLRRTAEGADYDHPDINAKGRFSARSLVACAVGNLYDLSWQPAAEEASSAR